MQSILSASWNTLSQADPLLWTIPLVISVTGLFWWFTRKAAVRPVALRLARLQRSTGRAQRNANRIATESRAVGQQLHDQAASLGDATAELDEMSILARQTADAAGEVAKLSLSSRRSAERGGVVLSKVIKAMEETQAGLDETGELIRTVDEVTMQANLLALSAAVEASRMGACGDKLASMAEELHDVALRSAEAARVAELVLRRTIGHSRSGMETASGLRVGLVELDGATGRMNRLAHEIADAEHAKALELKSLHVKVAESQQVIDRAATAAAETATAGDEIGVQIGRADSLARELMVHLGEPSEEAEGAPAPSLAVPMVVAR